MSPAGARRAVVIVVLALVFASGPAVPFLGPGGAERTPAGIAAGAADSTPADNGSVRHENPEVAGQDGNLDDLQGWLAGRISSRLQGSTANVSQGQYDAAEGLLGNETREYLSRFVDVAGETEREDDDRAAETIEETVERQRNFTRAVANYSALYDEYLAAREAGNLTRARRLARRLLDLEGRIDRTGENLSRNYRTIERTTGSNTTAASRNLDATTQNVSERTANVSDDLFSETRIVITSGSASASVLDPVRVRGRVLAANGTPVTGGTVELPAERARAAVNESGYFDVSYRPVLVERGEQSLAVRYRPAAESVFLGSTARLNVTIAGYEPRLELSGVPERVGFGDPVRFTADLTVAGVPIDGAPIRATLNGVVLNRTRTANGTGLLLGRVPASVDDGRRELRVRLPVSGRAVEAVTVTRRVEVVETGTRLAVEATRVSADRVRVEGRLRTDAGGPVPEQPVAITVGGETAGEVLTNASGRFNRTFPIPAAVNGSRFGARGVAVNATFVAPATNLAPARGNARLTLRARPLGNGGGPFGAGYPWWFWLAAVVAIAAVAGGTYVVLSRRRESLPGEADGFRENGPEPAGTPEPDPGAGSGGTAVEALLAAAREHLDAGETDEATQAGYEAVRRSLADRVGLSAGTHWELYRACAGAELPEKRLRALRRLVESYEHAAFAPGALSAERAREALGAARDVLDG